MVTRENGRVRLSIIETIDSSYDISIGSNLFTRIVGDLQKKPIGKKYAIVTDSNVGPLYAESLNEGMRLSGLDSRIVVMPAGERHKTMDTQKLIATRLEEDLFGRDSTIIALGGGVVCDVAGSVAAQYARGIPFIQVPTSTLAQADASVGGKTGVDGPTGKKNNWGSFYQPKVIYLDVETTRTQDEMNFRAGFAETLKHAIIKDVAFFEYLLANRTKIGLGPKGVPTETLIEIAHENCFIKGSVVEQDPRERTGIRQILNYGHTFGHAYETAMNFTVPHGFCVSIGMTVAANVAHEITKFPKGDMYDQEEALKAFGLPTRIPRNAPIEEILKIMKSDKKVRDGRVRFSLPNVIGEMEPFDDNSYATPVAEPLVREAIANSMEQ